MSRPAGLTFPPWGKMKGGNEYKKRYILFTAEIHKIIQAFNKKNKQ